VYNVRVCESPNPLGPDQAPFNFVGTYDTNDVATPTAQVPYPPEWKFFTNAPPLDYSNTDTRTVGCWENIVNGSPVPGCQLQLKNTAARAPWDHNVQTNTPTFTTTGNAASTAEAWVSPLTPGGTFQKPVDNDRTYGLAGATPSEDFTNSWLTSKCDPTTLTPGGNDILAAVTNLFSGHNRFHDFAYYLGFTEQNFNMQQNNFGNNPGGDPSRENDPEIGNVQAGAIDGGPTGMFLGRDNANQITENDGIPGITNQYLFQPIPGGFYAPCVDGDFDTTVFGHEYTHAISNRMVGGPDAGLTGAQAGAMGESWSDQDALEYLHEFNFIPLNGENPWAEGPYVTGNKQTGIRDYALNNNPLNYGDIGFDTPGVEVHADGEIWNGTAYEIRQALVNKYNATFPESDVALQKRCADGILPADQCPGNRRWIQIVYDAFLLMQASPSMLDARDAYLAADVMRFGGANQNELWNAFAKRGMGQFAFSSGSGDGDPKPNFESPNETDEATVTFQLVDSSLAPVTGKIFAGDYEARATPVADTDSATPLSSTAKFVPGTYTFVVQAPGFGMTRVTRTFSPNQVVTVALQLPRNVASSTSGATATASSGTAAGAIDDTEATQWTGTGEFSGATHTPQSITINQAGTAPVTINQVNVSAMIGPGGSGRFSALRSFRLETSTDGTTFTPVFTSASDAFPSGLPRPLAPAHILRTFTLPSPVSATHLRLVALTNQCNGAPAYAGEQDNDPLNNTDCATGDAPVTDVTVAEVQAFSALPSCPGYAADPRVQIVGTSGNDTLTGTNGGDVICGLGGNDTLRGLGGNDVLLGGDGKDTLFGGAGNDTFDGGNGVDTTSFAEGPVASGVTADLSGAAAVCAGIPCADNAQLGHDTFVTVAPGGCSTVENLTGSGFNDSLTGDACNNTLFGANGNDTLSGLGGNDTLQGTGGNDTLFGGAGNDLLLPGTGDDPAIEGGSGFDTLAYSDITSGGVNIDVPTGTTTALGGGNAGTDHFTPATLEAYYGSNQADTITGDTAANLLYGLGAIDHISGGGGNDTMGGGAGADVIDGGNGVDTSTYFTAPAGATVNLTTGTASNDGTGSADTLANVENVLGTNFVDSITGSATSNALYGFSGNDTISALDGNDFLDGGANTDTLNGGNGTDRCLNGETLSGCESTTAPAVASSLLARARAEARTERLLAKLAAWDRSMAGDGAPGR
jgi:Ca2+-binding RTX toxin-like protein